MNAAIPKSFATALVETIKASIESNPFESDGRLWCQKSNSNRATAIGAKCTKTVERALKKAPFATDTIIIENVGKIVLARIAEPGEPLLPRAVARIMRTVWRKYLEVNIPMRRKELEAEISALETIVSNALDPLKVADQSKRLETLYKWKKRLRKSLKETEDEFGCFIGLAKDWPDGLQVQIFQIVLENWSGFMDCIKIKQDIEQASKQPVEFKAGEIFRFFFDYPHIATIRKFWEVAVDVAGTHFQSQAVTGQDLPDGFKQSDPWFWDNKNKGLL